MPLEPTAAGAAREVERLQQQLQRALHGGFARCSSAMAEAPPRAAHTAMQCMVLWRTLHRCVRVAGPRLVGIAGTRVIAHAGTGDADASEEAAGEHVAGGAARVLYACPNHSVASP